MKKRNLRKALEEGAQADADGGGARGRGRAVQVDPIKLTLKVPGTKRLKLKHDEPLSKFAFEFNLRRYNADIKKLRNKRFTKIQAAHAGRALPEP